MATKLLFPEDARSWLRRRYENQRRQWIAGEGAWPLTVSLGDPIERSVADDAGLFRAWIEAWSTWTGRGQVVWEERRWPRLGVHQLPSRLVLPSALDVVHVIDDVARFSLARERYELLAERWGMLRGSAALARNAELLSDYPAADFERLIALVRWLARNPRSGHYLRQLPIAGMDTKWIDARRRGLVSELLRAIRGDTSASDFHDLCGLRRPPHRIRMRILCSQLRRQVGGLADLEAPIDDLAALELSPDAVLIVENLETGIALPELPGCVAFMKLGMSVSMLGALPWLADRPSLYWGDIDTHGYAILNRARAALPLARSVLMDEATLLAHRELCVVEAEPHRDANLPRLTVAERAMFDGLRDHRWGHALRLEQERIPWSVVPPALQAALAVR